VGIRDVAKQRPGHIILLLLGLALIAAGLLQLRAARGAVDFVHTEVEGTPVTLYRLAGSGGGPKPVVVISHGFAGSQQLMHSFALTLARRGYLAVTFDYLGHGRHPEPLRGDITTVEGATKMLVGQTRAIVDFALALPDASGELALLGHSMASDIVARYASDDPRVDATVAVSMFSTVVTPEQPKNLLVIVGGWEGFLRDEALRVLGLVADDPRPGVTFGNPTAGTGRRVAVAEGVEHVGVLYDVVSQREAADWLDEVFAHNGGSAIAQRGPGIMALLIGLAILARPLAARLPRLADPPLGAGLSWRELLPAALIPAVGTPLLLVAFPADFMGVLVGGYLAVHFLVYGVLSAIALWWFAGRRPVPRSRAARTDLPAFLATTAIVTAYLAGIFALALDSYVTSYAITATRLPLVLATGVGTLAYFLADEWMAHGEPTARGGHLYTRLCFLLSLGIAVALSFEELFFLLIIAAVIVIYFLVYGLFSRWVYRATGHPAVGAIANAVSFAWALGAVFPFLGG